MKTASLFKRKSTRTRGGKFKPHLQLQLDNLYYDIRTYHNYDTVEAADAAAERLAAEIHQLGCMDYKFAI